MALLGVRVAPGDDEHLLALLDQPLDHAAAGRQVEHVVLVDRRRRRTAAAPRAPSAVCGAYWMSSKTSVRRTTAPGVSARFSPTANLLVSTVEGRLGKSRREVARAADQVHPALVDARLDDRRVRPREVRRRERVEQVADGEARLALGAPVDVGVGDQAVDRLARPRGGSAAAAGTASSSARPDRRSAGRACPGGPPSARRRPAPARRPRLPDAAGGASGPAREAGGDADGGAGADEARAPSVGRVGQQNVERGAPLGGLGHCDHLSRFLIEEPDSRAPEAQCHPIAVTKLRAGL